MLSTPHTLGVRRYVEGAKDAHGNPVKSWTAPEPWPVHGFAPGASEVTGDPNRDLSLILWTVYAPADALVPTERDLVVLGDVEYAVAARPADWTNGPWRHPTAGVVVELQRAEG